MKIKTVVTACERKQPTLDRTLQSLQNAGLDDITVHYDCPFPGDKRRGVIGQWLHAAKQTIEYNGGCDAVLMCQDDIIVARGLGAALRNLNWESSTPLWNACFSLYTPSKYADQPHGWVRPEGSYAWGACCLFFRLPDLIFFTNVMEEAVRDKQASYSGLDALIGMLLKGMGWDLLYHNPSLVQHIGETSTISNESASGWRCASNFVGEDFTEIVWP